MKIQNDTVNMDLFKFDIALSKSMNEDLDIFWKISEIDRYILKVFADSNNRDEFYKKLSEITGFVMPKIHFTVDDFFVRYEQVLNSKM